MRRGADHRRQARFGRRRHHPAGVGGVHGQARLAENVFARLEGRNPVLAVLVGPRPYDDGIDVRVIYYLAPVAADLRDPKVGGNPRRRLAAPVRHRGKLHSGNLLETGKVARPHYVAGANKSQTNSFIRHALAPRKR